MYSQKLLNLTALLPTPFSIPGVGKSENMVVKRVLLSAAFGLIYYASVFVGSAVSASTDWRYGVGHALLFGTFFFVVSFPILLIGQRGLVMLWRRLRKSERRDVTFWEFVPCVLVSALFLSALIPRLPESYYRRLVADRIPTSVTEMEFWEAHSFSGRFWIFTFRIAPGDLDQVLTRYQYKEESCPGGYMPLIPEGTVRLPEEPLVHHYSYCNEPETRPKWVDVYANAKKNRVYVMGGCD